MLKLDSFLLKYPVFHINDAFEYFQGEASKKAIMKRIQYSTSTGRLANLCRGVYAVEPFGHMPSQHLIMASLRKDAVFCGHSALDLHGVGYSVWHRCTAYTEQRRFHMRVKRAEFLALSHPVELVKAGKKDLGVTTAPSGGMVLRVLSPERILVEGLLNPRYFGGYEELFQSFLDSFDLNLGLVEELALVFDRKRLYRALGWFFELYQKEYLVPESFLDKLQRLSETSSPCYLTRALGKGHLIKRWNLIVPPWLMRVGEVY